MKNPYVSTLSQSTKNSESPKRGRKVKGYTSVASHNRVNDGRAFHQRRSLFVQAVVAPPTQPQELGSLSHCTCPLRSQVHELERPEWRQDLQSPACQNLLCQQLHQPANLFNAGLQLGSSFHIGVPPAREYQYSLTSPPPASIEDDVLKSTQSTALQ